MAMFLKASHTGMRPALHWQTVVPEGQCDSQSRNYTYYMIHNKWVAFASMAIQLHQIWGSGIFNSVAKAAVWLADALRSSTELEFFSN